MNKNVAFKWFKKQWELAGLLASVVVGIFGQAAGEWRFLPFFLFATVLVTRVFYYRSPQFQALLARSQRALRIDLPRIDVVDATPRAFRGLLPFRETDAAEFAKLGRQDAIAALLPAVREPSIPVIVLRGAPGAGKTSLIRAGIVPSLDPKEWTVVDIDPNKPTIGIDELNRFAVRTLHKRILVIADQFEEHFIAGGKSNLRVLCETLRLTTEGENAKWLIGVREDFKYLIDDLMELFGGEFQLRLLQPRAGYGLKAFTISQAEVVLDEISTGLFEPGVVAQLGRDLARDGRVLPADLQFVGYEMQDRGIRTLKDYQMAGGRDGLVATSIKNTIEQYGSEKRQADVRKLLNSLVDREYGTRLADALSADEIAARAGVKSDVTELMKPLVARRLILPIGDRFGNGAVRYKLAHDYLVQPIYIATARMETDYEKVQRLLWYYSGRYQRDSRLTIPGREFLQIRRLLRRVGQDERLHEARRAASEVLRVTHRKRLRQRGILALAAFLVAIYIPPVRGTIATQVNHFLNRNLTLSAHDGTPYVCVLDGLEVKGAKARVFRYWAYPFVKQIVVPELVAIPEQATLDSHASDQRSEGSGTFTAIGRFEVTVAQYNAYAAEIGHEYWQIDPNLPRNQVDYEAARGYCRWLSRIVPYDIRLPTTKEWETVCGAHARTDQSVREQQPASTLPKPVGRSEPNSFNIYNLRDNLSEWCQFSTYRSIDISDNDIRLGVQHLVEIRGASFANPDFGCEGPDRLVPDSPAADIGFRCAVGRLGYDFIDYSVQ